MLRPESGVADRKAAAQELVIPDNAVRVTTFTLTGSVNQSTMSADFTSGHFGTDITLVTYVGGSSLPDAIEGDPNLVISHATLTNGANARVEAPDNGYGPIRVQWVHGGNSYFLISYHFKTDEGTSGIRNDQLLKMAGSIG